MVGRNTAKCRAVGLLARLREFAHTQLPDRVHQALIRNDAHDRLVGHLSRDSTAIEAREKPPRPTRRPRRPSASWDGRGKAKNRPKVLKRLDRQATMSAGDARRPAHRLRRGHEEEQQGLSGHLGRLQAAPAWPPARFAISCLLSVRLPGVHDSQAAIPLATIVRRADDQSL